MEKTLILKGVEPVQKKIEVLVAAMHRTNTSIYNEMNIQTDAVIINQCDRFERTVLTINGNEVKFYSFNERGVGRSGNNALMNSSADMDRIVKVCKKHSVLLIEDAAEGLGALYKGKHRGSFGDYGVFSFNDNKIITTSGGGMLVSNDEKKIAKIRLWVTQARDPASHYQYSELGYNYRMSNIIVGIGRGQLKVLDQRVQKKREIFEFYKRELGGLEGVEMMTVNEWNEPNCWLSCITLNGKIRPLDIMEALEAENIESRPIWKTMYM